MRPWTLGRGTAPVRTSGCWATALPWTARRKAAQAVVLRTLARRNIDSSSLARNVVVQPLHQLNPPAQELLIGDSLLGPADQHAVEPQTFAPAKLSVIEVCVMDDFGNGGG